MTSNIGLGPIGSSSNLPTDPTAIRLRSKRQNHQKKENKLLWLTGISNIKTAIGIIRNTPHETYTETNFSSRASNVIKEVWIGAGKMLPICGVLSKLATTVGIANPTYSEARKLAEITKMLGTYSSNPTRKEIDQLLNTPTEIGFRALSEWTIDQSVGLASDLASKTWTAGNFIASTTMDAIASGIPFVANHPATAIESIIVWRLYHSFPKEQGKHSAFSYRGDSMTINVKTISSFAKRCFTGLVAMDVLIGSPMIQSFPKPLVNLTFGGSLLHSCYKDHTDDKKTWHTYAKAAVAALAIIDGFYRPDWI